MARKKKSGSAMDFIVSTLKKRPKIEYASLRDAAEKKGHTIYPVMYGRAQALLGHTSKRRGKKAKTGRRGRPANGRRRGRPANGRRGRPANGRRRGRRPGGSALDSLHSIVAAMKESEAERARYQRVLEQIRDLLNKAV